MIAKPPVEFGCDQVVIVRDQKAKTTLPSILSHALCLTVYEAKGLEFDDVILYNFFTDSQMDRGEWQMLSYLGVRKIEYTRKEAKDTFNFRAKANLIDKYGVKTQKVQRERTWSEILELVESKREEL